jgi:hypothetical protein
VWGVGGSTHGELHTAEHAQNSRAWSRAPTTGPVVVAAAGGTTQRPKERWAMRGGAGRRCYLRPGVERGLRRHAQQLRQTWRQKLLLDQLLIRQAWAFATVAHGFLHVGTRMGARLHKRPTAHSNTCVQVAEPISHTWRVQNDTGSVNSLHPDWFFVRTRASKTESGKSSGTRCDVSPPVYTLRHSFPSPRSRTSSSKESSDSTVEGSCCQVMVAALETAARTLTAAGSTAPLTKQRPRLARTDQQQHRKNGPRLETRENQRHVRVQPFRHRRGTKTLRTSEIVIMIQ